LMQDRTSANSMKVLLQRTAGPYIGSQADITPALDHVCFAHQSRHYCALFGYCDVRPESAFGAGEDRAIGLLIGPRHASQFVCKPNIEKPHPSYSRLSRYDETGLCWLLQGREVVALTEATATIRNPDTGAITMYRLLIGVSISSTLFAS
jgi:hypothetical protein